MTIYDVVISQGTIYDGSTTPGYQANIGILGDQISVISTDALPGRTVIDATGLAVTPGFIDLHSHSDYTIEAAPQAEGQLAQGVTTLVTGNCGWSPFPVRDLQELQQFSAFLGNETSWTWTDLESYAQAVNACRPAINIAPQIGHVSLRLAAMGSEQRTPTDDELADMRSLLNESARQGVWGLSSGLIYAPGSFANASELNALVATAGEADLLYSTHMRDETSNLLEAVAEAIATVEASGGRLEISHLKVMGPANHGRVVQALELITEAQRRGVDVTADVYPYTASGTTLISRMPNWAQDGGVDAFLERLRDPQLRAKIADEVRQRIGVDIDVDGIVINDVQPGPFSADIGRSVGQIARDRARDSVQIMLEILEGHHGLVSIVNHSMDPADVVRVLQHPLVSVASDGDLLSIESEGSAHPRSFGTFARILGRYVREDQVLSLSEAVRKMTSLPAQRLGMNTRGVLAVGYVADISVFDPERVIDLSLIHI